MGARRLLSKSLLFGTEMSKVSLRARLLYIAIVLEADDWGVVDIESPLGMTDSTFSELDELVDAGFIFVTRLSSFYLVRHWFSQNLVPENRRSPSLHPELLSDFSYSLEKGSPDKNYHIKNQIRKAEARAEPVLEELTPEDMKKTQQFMERIGLSMEL